MTGPDDEIELEPRDRAVFGGVHLGIALVFALHLGAGALLLVVSTVADAVGASAVSDLVPLAVQYWLFGLSVAQLVYVLPIALVFAFVRRQVALGMTIGAALTFLLQGTCYGIFAVGVFLMALVAQAS